MDSRWLPHEPGWVNAKSVQSCVITLLWRSEGSGYSGSALQCTLSRRGESGMCVPVLDQLVKANISYDRERLIGNGNEFHYLGVNGFGSWVVLLKCSYAFKWLLDLLTARSTQQTLWARLGMLCCMCSATFYVASLLHVLMLYTVSMHGSFDISFEHHL